MKKSLSLAATVLVGVTTLSACGGGSGDYCGDLESLQDDFASASELTSETAEEVFAAFGQLAESAPDEVADDWETVDSNLEGFQSALEDAGLDLANLEDIDPTTLDEDATAAIQEAYANLANEDSQAAFTAIEEHALDECDVDLSE
ncbi:hypothetical protein HMPREF0063_10585 [Aeromicrobium marinum DSM 15272]|uniref:Lipoprotein n=1 Tax=Aeromicrobium marinum DSM 15272 TaxID=585531 RepID=E2S9E5_9ACTN|nr:hypothetical protein [Aeromicrobium marinum]EFQ83869.1 hypothetical protein HMPREF0063_10585 [Aeromicrobium marinum DSM 15272]